MYASISLQPYQNEEVIDRLDSTDEESLLAFEALIAESAYPTR